jgi:hypothetical protein
MRRRSMKLVKNFVYAALLTSVLAITASAGDQLGGGIVAPPPPPKDMIAQDDPTICDPNTGCLSTETSDSLFYEALAALLSVY